MWGNLADGVETVGVSMASLLSNRYSLVLDARADGCWPWVHI